MACMISYHHFDSLGTQPSKRRPSKTHIDGSKPIYVPHFVPTPNPPKSIVSLVESKTRVFLPPTYLYGTNTPQSNSYNSDNVKKQISELYDTNKVLLDLGTEPLRRVVHEMHRLASDHAPASHDPFAAKNAGMLPYCEYLKGIDNSIEMRRKRESENVKLRTEMIMKGTYNPNKNKPRSGRSSTNSRSPAGGSPTTRSRMSKTAASSVYSRLTPSKLML